MAITITGKIIGTGKSIALPTPASGGAIGVWAGGAGNLDVMDWITISTTADAADFGDLLVGEDSKTGVSNGTGDIGVFAGGIVSNVMEYITITTPGNAQDFGDLTVARAFSADNSNGSSDRAVFSQGFISGGVYSNTMDFITVSTPGNAVGTGETDVESIYCYGVSNGVNDRGVYTTGHSLISGFINVLLYFTISSGTTAVDFGDLFETRHVVGSSSNDTNERGIFGGNSKTIDYITISTTGNAQDFGDLTVARIYPAGASNGTSERGCFGTGSTTDIIDYVTISTAGDAVDFGNATVARNEATAASNGAS